eukprot:CCRYP_012264-RB/>CCRYP_012264-RB protein AED:0.10 eAED:0.10 QI:1451/1/1/1/0.85/0.75/8/259/226
MKLTLMILFIASVAIDAYRMRGSEHVPEDKSVSSRELYFRRRYPDNRKSGLTLFLVEEDTSPDTISCTSDIADALYDCVDVVVTSTDRGTDPSDYVYYVSSSTECDSALSDIEDTTGCNAGYRVYYYGGNNRYWSDRNNRWYRYDDNKDNKDDKNDDDYTPRHRWWNDNGNNKNDRDNHSHRSWWHDRAGGGGDHHGGWSDHGQVDGGNDKTENPKDEDNGKDGNR